MTKENMNLEEYKQHLFDKVSQLSKCTSHALSLSKTVSDVISDVEISDVSFVSCVNPRFITKLSQKLEDFQIQFQGLTYHVEFFALVENVRVNFHKQYDPFDYSAMVADGIPEGLIEQVKEAATTQCHYDDDCYDWEF